MRYLKYLPLLLVLCIRIPFSEHGIDFDLIGVSVRDCMVVMLILCAAFVLCVRLWGRNIWLALFFGLCAYRWVMPVLGDPMVMLGVMSGMVIYLDYGVMMDKGVGC